MKINLTSFLIGVIITLAFFLFTGGLFMPKKYSKKSLPTPIHKLIKTREIPSELVAVRKYSGTWSKKNFEYQKDILLEELNKKKIKLDRKIIFSRYNSPYSLWFLRRNEVKIPIINELISEKN
mgnify:CR=1 FL=1